MTIKILNKKQILFWFYEKYSKFGENRVGYWNKYVNNKKSEISNFF